VNLNNLEHFLDDQEEIDHWEIEIAKEDNDPYELDEMVLYLSLLKEVEQEKFAAYLNAEVLSLTEVSFNKINFISRKQMHQRVEIESAIKAKKIVDKRPK
jgi:hypothetical protein